MGRHPGSVSAQILNRIRRHGRGWAFTSDDFDDLGSDAIVRAALMRFEKSGDIRRLDRGLYDYPRKHKVLGLLAPSSDDVAKAVAGRTARLQPAGAYAANLLGLSEQVPMRIVYLTDDFSRVIKIGNQQIALKSTTPKNMATAGRTSGLVIQALRHLGQRHVDDSTVAILRKRLSDEDRKRLLKDVQFAPSWVAKVMRQVAAD